MIVRVFMLFCWARPYRLRCCTASNPQLAHRYAGLHHGRACFTITQLFLSKLGIACILIDAFAVLSRRIVAGLPLVSAQRILVVHA